MMPKLAPHVRDLAQAVADVAGGLGARAVRQHAADRGLAVAVAMSADGGGPLPLAAAVEFEIASGPRGRLVATNVVLAKRPANDVE